ncbi:hypothetical protein PG989_004663 [Apiospora arundinis]
MFMNEKVVLPDKLRRMGLDIAYRLPPRSRRRHGDAPSFTTAQALDTPSPLPSRLRYPVDARDTRSLTTAQPSEPALRPHSYLRYPVTMVMPLLLIVRKLAVRLTRRYHEGFYSQDSQVCPGHTSPKLAVDFAPDDRSRPR